MNIAHDKKVVIKKRLKGQSREALEQLGKTELIDKIVQLEAYNFQLKNLLAKKLNENDRKDPKYAALFQTQELTQKNESTAKPLDKNDKKRAFNWASAHKRHVLLKVLYFGWDYQGFAVQEDSNDTIEAHLFRALTRTCLIESRANSNYHRCGRTDKEVSAFCQVISIDLRSKHDPSQQHEPAALASEIDYCGLLNRVLPKNIQCVAWMPLRSAVYSARFDCVGRRYRYYFPKGDLDIEAMRLGCQLLVRHADFRNFCKMDVHNGVTNYMRNVQAARVEPCELTDVTSGYAMHYLEIQANAFLWHQIRCIMAVLLLIGQGREQPSVISELLDVSVNPCKPQYMPAIGLPLNLFHCEFRAYTTRTANENEIIDDVPMVVENGETPRRDPDLCDWIHNEEALQKVIENVQCEWAGLSIKSTMIHDVLNQLETLLASTFKTKDVSAQVLLLQDGIKPRQYQPLLQRKRGESLENRIDHFVKKQRLVKLKDDTS